MGSIIDVRLDTNFVRPVIPYPIAEGNLDVLVDTGAFKPVWNGSSDTLLVYFPDAELTEYKTTVSGFGGSSKNIREVWKIPHFELTDSIDQNKRYIIKNLLVAVIDDMDLGFNLILSATLFKKVNYTIANKDNNSPHMLIECDDREYYCIADGVKESNDVTYISRVTTFIQEYDNT